MKKNTRKRAAAAIGVYLMALGMFSGCTKQNDSSSASSTGAASNTTIESKEKEEELEPVTLHIYGYDPSGIDDEKVAKAMSEIPEVKALNVTVEFVKYPTGTYRDKIPLALASNEPMDIVFDAGWIAYASRVESQAYVDISEMLDTVAPTLKKTIPSNLWTGVTVDGGIYGVPTYKELGEQWGVYAETDFLKEAKIDSTSIKTLEDVEVILEALSKTDRAGFQITGNTNNPTSLYSNTAYYSLSDAVKASKDNTGTLVNYYASENFANLCNLMRDWYNKGYIAADVATRENYDEFIKNGIHKYGVSIISYAPQNEVIQSTNYGKDLTYIPLNDIVVSTNACTGSINAICAKSENPERALQFLEVWNTVPAVKNMMTYGIEGVHYNLVNGQVKQVEGYADLWSGSNWTTGNSMISYTLVGESTDKWEQYEVFNAKGSKSCFLGFTVNNTKVADKVSAITATIKEYVPLLNCGAVDPAEYLPKFLDALDKAGINDVVAEYQTQYDAWKK